MVVLGLMTVYTNPDAAGQSVPTLFMVQNGVGASFMTPLISILIILGAVSTAVNMVAAMVKRICGGTEKRAAEKSTDGSAVRNKPEKNEKFRVTHKEIIAALVGCVVDFGLPVRAAYADPESIQSACLSCNPGYSYPVSCTYDCDKI